MKRTKLEKKTKLEREKEVLELDREIELDREMDEIAARCDREVEEAAELEMMRKKDIRTKFVVFGVISLLYWIVCLICNPTRAIFSYYFAFLSVLACVIGASFFVLIQHAACAGWSVLLRRSAEIIMSTMFFLVLLFVFVIINLDALFIWTNKILDAELGAVGSFYLNKTYWILRSVLYFSFWIFVARSMGLRSFKQDYAKDFSMVEEASLKMKKTSYVKLLFFAYTVTFAAIDWIMALQPHWFSSIFGVYFFASCFLMGLACIFLLSIYLEVPITKEHFQDIGKLMFGFTVFWSYIAFSQFMLIWYSDLPEEVTFYLSRLHSKWEYLSYGLIGLNFLFPFFFLISKERKRSLKNMVFISLWILFSQCVHFYWLVMPVLNETDLWTSLDCDFAAMFFVFSMFIAYVLRLSERRYIYPINDPFLEESATFENH